MVRLASVNRLADTLRTMFTGIITATTAVSGSHKNENGLELVLKKPTDWTDLVVGESISTNGVCLTVASMSEDTYTVFLIPETLAKTTFGKCVPLQVNLERALQMQDRLGGHFVQGHVDTKGTIVGIDSSDGYIIEVNYPEKFKPLVIPKGSITVDGIALTVVSTKDNVLRVAIIPHTLQNTTIHALKLDDYVNLEFDLLGKYVVNLLEVYHAAS